MAGLWVSPGKYIEFGEGKATGLRREIASRSLAWDYSAMIGLLPDPDPILTKRGDGAEVLEELTADGQVLTAIQTRKLGTLKREYKFEPGTVDGKEDARAEQLCKDLAADLEDVGMYDLLSGLLDAPYYGMTPAELFWEPREGSIHLTNIRILPNRWFGFDGDNQPRFRSLANQTEGDEIPWGKMVFARHCPTYDNPFGLRLLSRCLWPVAFKKGGTKFWVTFCEKYGMPFLLGRYRSGASPEEQAALLSALTKMVQDAVAVVPEGNLVELLGGQGKTASSGGSYEAFERLRAAMDAEISKVLMGQTLTAEVGETGSYAASKTHEDVLDDYRQADQQLVKGVLDEIGKLYRDINAPEVPAPVFSWFESEDPQKEFAERDKMLTEGGRIKLQLAYYVRRYGFQEDEIVVAEGPSPAAATGSPAEKEEFAEPEAPGGAAIEQALLAWVKAQTASPAASLIDAAEELLGQVESLEEFRDKLIDLFAASEPERLGEIMARLELLGNLAGRYEVQAGHDD